MHKICISLERSAWDSVVYGWNAHDTLRISEEHSSLIHLNFVLPYLYNLNQIRLFGVVTLWSLCDMYFVHFGAE